MSQQRPVPPGSATSEAAALRQTGASVLRPGDPDQVGPYVPLALLGSGGMGRVYLARPVDGRPGLVAVKVIRPEYADDVRFRRRFEREALVHARLRTPYTPRLCGTGFRDELLWMATEYLPGPDLAEAVREGGALDTATVWRLTAELGRALTELAAAEIVHRDLKPSNVLLSVRGAHVIDFGISRAVDASAITGTGNRVGTPAYMSPEHLRTGESDTASDVFSLAGTLVYAATGHAPFGDGTGVDVMHRVAFEDPNPALLTQISAADEALGALLSACLAKEPAHRPAPQELVATAEPHTGARPVWPEPLESLVQARQQAYELLNRLPVDRRARLGSPGEHPGDVAGPLETPRGGRAASAPWAAGHAVPTGRAAGPAAAQGAAAASGQVVASGPAVAAGQAEPAASSADAASPALQGTAGSSGAGRRAGAAGPTDVVAPRPSGPSGTRAWVRRKPVLAVVAAAVVCAVGAGVFVLTRQDTPVTAHAPGAGTKTSMNATSGGEPLSSAPGGSDGPSAEGASGRNAGDNRGAAGHSGAADSIVDEAEDTADAGDVGDTADPGAADGPSGTPSSGADEPGSQPSGSSPSPSDRPSESAAPAWISDCTYYAGNGRTSRGDQGKRVRQVQCMLSKRGYAVGEVDGKFGRATESAVLGFQRATGLSDDGVVGKATWSALRSSS